MKRFLHIFRNKYTFAFLALVSVLAIIVFSNNPLKISQASNSSPTNYLSGWAWSSNIGWVSFNCADEGVCSNSNYGVQISTSTGKLSGYAWSSNIGWINFAPAGPYPENPQTSAVVSTSTRVASGWIRALSHDNSYDDGWDGWIQITDASSTASSTNGKLNGWAWGGPVVGWLNFWNVNIPTINSLQVVHATPVIQTITVLPSTPSITIGSNQAFNARVTDKKGNVLPVVVRWTSSDLTIATINPSTGIATGVADGTVTITAADDVASGTAILKVANILPAPVLRTITVSPSAPSITQGSAKTFTAVGYDQNGKAITPTPTWTWTSSNPTVAAINSSGVAMGITEGTATITAAIGTVSGNTTLTVNSNGNNNNNNSVPVLKTITVSPSAPSIMLGNTQVFTAKGLDQNGSGIAMIPVWTSSNPKVVTIDPSTGVATGVAEGMVTITATDGTVSGNATLTVTKTPSSLVLATIAVSPFAQSIAIGNTQAFTATGYDASGTIITPTPTWTWTSSNPTIATINSSAGVATGVAEGTVTITATDGTISGTATLNVDLTAPVNLLLCKFGAKPTSITPSQTSTLSWACEYATNTCFINQSVGSNIGIVDNVSGTRSVKPAATTKYTLTCNGSNGSSILNTRVNVITTKEGNPLGNYFNQ